jgi:hypothetical protein
MAGTRLRRGNTAYCISAMIHQYTGLSSQAGAARHFATVPIGTLLSVSEETARHPLWRAQNAI